MTERRVIVCVDDEPLVLNAMQRTLRSRLGPSYAIEMASNGAEALELIAELQREDTPPRMIVSDAMMPIMDGYELLRRVHALLPGVKKILVTGYGNEAEIDRLCAEVELIATFDKPWDPDELCAVIEQALGETST